VCVFESDSAVMRIVGQAGNVCLGRGGNHSVRRGNV
jgi:hypothetical protein